MKEDVAPQKECIVCEAPLPSTSMYLPHVRPVGAHVCGDDCLHVALRRFDRTGRVDGKVDSPTV